MRLLPLLSLFLTPTLAGWGFVWPQTACRLSCENGGVCTFNYDQPSLHRCECLIGIYEGELCQWQVGEPHIEKPKPQVVQESTPVRTPDERLLQEQKEKAAREEQESERLRLEQQKKLDEEKRLQEQRALEKKRQEEKQRKWHEERARQEAQRASELSKREEERKKMEEERAQRQREWEERMRAHQEAEKKRKEEQTRVEQQRAQQEQSQRREQEDLARKRAEEQQRNDERHREAERQRAEQEKRRMEEAERQRQQQQYHPEENTLTEKSKNTDSIPEAEGAAQKNVDADWDDYDKEEEKKDEQNESETYPDEEDKHDKAGAWDQNTVSDNHGPAVYDDTHMDDYEVASKEEGEYHREETEDDKLERIEKEEKRRQEEERLAKEELHEDREHTANSIAHDGEDDYWDHTPEHEEGDWKADKGVDPANEFHDVDPVEEIEPDDWMMVKKKQDSDGATSTLTSLISLAGLLILWMW